MLRSIAVWNSVDRLANTALDNVVAKDDADLLPVGKMLCQRQGIGDSALALLIGVVDVDSDRTVCHSPEAAESPRHSCPRSRSKFRELPASTRVWMG